MLQGDAEMGLRLAGTLSPFWRIRGHLREGRAWLEQLLALPAASTAPPEVPRPGARCPGWPRHFMGDYDEAASWLEESLTLRQEVGDPLAIARTLNSLALVSLQQNAFERSGRSTSRVSPWLANRATIRSWWWRSTE